jgi:hypothetical protein
MCEHADHIPAFRRNPAKFLQSPFEPEYVWRSVRFRMVEDTLLKPIDSVL